ncbi:T9SS type A sorting domain-containing protein [Hymenobacter cellulosilyticus]|uniref:T9SS type A sorting domain-containing protein n=1 Tax=Hymenobacter cellulosilyticus TaxID=2932248 RepID=A0A8T9Q6L4_9BACT|nr:T9SS type A sorting domain-containing protein [Hymenobacter cellulosilyticus]UOQ73204.1 T9SS type A sorting domain-containing protein [Hymenobacter cellulosilyticus]
MQNFTRTLTVLLVLLFSATLAMAQTTYPTIGIIGSATAKGWDASTAMTAGTGANNHQWTITLPLTVGEVKFRANDNWDVNWGAATFPSGVGVANGPNIPVATAGNYSVTFNDITGAYTFTRNTTASTTASRPTLSLALAPNPARETVRVAYELTSASSATLTVLNMLGQPVQQLSAVRQGAGQQEQLVSLRNLAAGLYLVQVQAGNQLQTARLLVD